jgi:hypothetical protein
MTRYQHLYSLVRLMTNRSGTIGFFSEIYPANNILVLSVHQSLQSCVLLFSPSFMLFLREKLPVVRRKQNDE